MTLFEKIIQRHIPADIVFEDDQVLAFKDINPAAPTHVLVIPKRPISRIDAANAEDQLLIGDWMRKVAEIARELKLENGFRLVINNGPDGGESVPHLHCHILGGRALQWPPG